MTNSKYVPKRRFKEFVSDGEWVKRELGDVSTSYSGGTPTVGNREYYGDEIPFIRSAEINSEFTELSLTKIGLEKSSAKMVNIGDILYALYGATSGEVGISKIKGAINQAVLCIIPQSEYDSNFIVHWLRFQKENIINTYLQGGQGNLSGSMVKELVINFPKLSEQRKIGKLFQKLDRLISIHQHKLDKLKNLKKAYLSEMFPAEGKRVPKRRFPGFEGEWEQKKLGDIAEIYDGTHQTPRYTHKGVMFLSVENIKTLKSSKYISKDDFIKDFKIFPQNGDVLMTRIGDIGTSNVVNTDSELAFYVSLALIRSSVLDSNFLNISISSSNFQKELWRRTLHIAFPKKINKNEIGEVSILFPCIAEQKQIGEFFHKLDNSITLQQQKLDKLNDLKKAYLNELFV